MANGRWELKRIGVFSAVKTLFLVGGVGGFLCGIIEWAVLSVIFSIGASGPLGDLLQNETGMGQMMSTGMGVMAILLPIFGGFAGAVSGVIFGFLMAGIYNIGARMWGGLELEWNQQTVASAPPPSYGAPTTPPAPPGPKPEPPPERPSSAMYE